MRVVFGVLGPVMAWDDTGEPIALKGPRHRAVLAQLIIARRRVVPVTRLVDDLWEDPPAGAVSAVRTFVAALRRALEPQRPPRAPARILVTEGPGYALRAEPDTVDAWRFERTVTATAALPPRQVLARLEEALGWWRGPGYAEFADEPWARAERAKLAELRLHAVERQAEARLALGLAAEAVPELDAHVAEHPWREDAWRLLALALYRSGRQGDALAVLRRARTLLVEQLGVDPGPALRRLEADVLAQAEHLGGEPGAGAAPGSAAASGSADVGSAVSGPSGAGAAGVGSAVSGPSGAGAADVGSAVSGSAGVGAGAAPGPGSGPRAPASSPGAQPHDEEEDEGEREHEYREYENGAYENGVDENDAYENGAYGYGGYEYGHYDMTPARTVEPGPWPEPDSAPDPAGIAAQVWARAAADYDRAVSAGARARLESTVGLLRSLAVTGGQGLQAARAHRVAAVAAAEELGDPELTARVIGAYDVPAIWTRTDDPAQAARIVAAAERTVAALPGPHHAAARARLLATIALESRGEPGHGEADHGEYGLDAGPVSGPHGSDAGPQGIEVGPSAADSGRPYEADSHRYGVGPRPGRGAAPDTFPPRAARQAVEIARGLDDPALLAFALNGLFMHTFHRTGLAPRRDRIGAELIALSARHGLVTYEVLGHLIRVQARSALADFATADRHADAADRLAVRHELPLVGVFTQWYRALRLAAYGPQPLWGAAPAPPAPSPAAPPGPVPTPTAAPGPASYAAAEAAYREAATLLDGAGMPGLQRGLLPLVLLCLRLAHGRPAQADAHDDWGPYAPWVRPLVLLAEGRRAEAATALRRAPAPPRDLLLEALWCLIARAAIEVGDRELMGRARGELAPAAGELAGAGSGLLTLGPVSHYLAALDAALG